MEHAEAIRDGTVERYLLEELDDSARREFEEHFFDCQECAEEVRLTAGFLDNARAVMRETGPAAKVGAAGWWARFWPMPLAGAAAMLVLGAGASYLGVAAFGGRASSPAAIQPVSWHFLAISRAGPPTLNLCPREQIAPLVLSRTMSADFPSYRTDVKDASGKVQATGTIPSSPPGEELRLLLPVAGLPSGAYVLELTGVGAAGSGPATAVARYPFVLARSGECP